MKKHTRRRVTGYEIRPNTSPDELSRRLHPQVYIAILECGHEIPQGVDSTRQRFKACWQCEPPPLFKTFT